MNRNRRLRATQKVLDNQPFLPSAVDSAYAKLLKSGELPTDNRLAWTVLKRALHARKPPPAPTPAELVVAALSGNKANGQSSASLEQTRSPMTGSPRERVFKEAVHPYAPARDVARLAIHALVKAGHDPSDPEFVPTDTEMPEFGTVSLHLFGWPDQLVKPEYEAQMARVMRQHAELRAQSPRTDEWYREASLALAAFMARGELPDDDLLRGFALTVAEMFALHVDYFGRGDAAMRATVLAAFEAAANASGEEREAALRHLGGLQPSAWEALRDARS